MSHSEPETRKFLRDEKSALKKLQTKSQKTLRSGGTCDFKRSAIIHVHPGVHLSSQPDNITQLELPVSAAGAISARSKFQFVATATKSDLDDATKLLITSLSPAKTATSDLGALRRLKKLINYSKNSKNEGLSFVHWDKSSSRIVVFTDASFGNT